MVLVFLVVSSLAAQPLTVGHMPSNPIVAITIGAGGTLAPVSFVDLGNPATATGTVNKASVMWNTTCAGNVFKIVFLRRNSTLTAYTVIATRGPFSSITGRNDVTLTPPVNVQAADLIGVVQLQPYNSCGSVFTQLSYNGLGFDVVTSGDISLAGTLGSTTSHSPGFIIGAVAYNADPLLVRILPAAGAVQGSGAFFRTSVQVQNFSSTTITGKFVFHKQGTTGSDSDPSLAFTVNPVQTLSYPDLITTMGQSGLGSIDVLTNGGTAPIVSARVFSDNGAAGTSGFTEEALAPNQALKVFQRGVLLIPPDLTNFRMNIGIRTLEAGATISIYTYNANGTLRGSRLNVAYAPNFFEQTTATLFTGQATLDPGGMIYVQPTAGGLIVYGTFTDNRTQDSAMRIATTD